MNLEIYGDPSTRIAAHGESTDERLELCPFCGSDVIIVSNSHTPSYSGQCDNCGTQGPYSPPVKRQAKTRAGIKRQHINAFKMAVHLWNTRRY